MKTDISAAKIHKQCPACFTVQYIHLSSLYRQQQQQQHGLVETSLTTIIHLHFYCLKPYQNDFDPCGLRYSLVGGLDGFDFHLRDFLRLFRRRHRRHDWNAVRVTVDGARTRPATINGINWRRWYSRKSLLNIGPPLAMDLPACVRKAFSSFLEIGIQGVVFFLFCCCGDGSSLVVVL